MSLGLDNKSVGMVHAPSVNEIGMVPVIITSTLNYMLVKGGLAVVTCYMMTKIIALRLITFMLNRWRT